MVYPPVALATATELDFVSLPDALDLVLLLIDDPRRFRRAALRWHARYCAEISDVGFEERIQAGCSGGGRERGEGAMAELVRRRGLEQVSEVLIRWRSGASLRSAAFFRAWILLDYLLDRDDLLDEHEALVLLNDLLDLGPLVSGHDEEHGRA